MSAITVTPDPYNSRVMIEATWDGPAEDVSLSRYDPDGVWRYVRLGNPVEFDAGEWAGDDFEAPLDVAVKYAMRSATSDITYSEATMLISQGLTWLKHPYQPALNVRVYPTEAPDVTRANPVGLFAVLGRNAPVAVTTARASDTGTLKFATSSSSEVTALRALLLDGSVLQLACPGGYGVGTFWIAAGDVVMSRYTHHAPTIERMWELTFTAVDRPS
jgi:hypothetical protein